MNYIAPNAEVLLVEDNEINMEVAIELLEPLSMKLDTASDGQQAVDKVKEKKYDLILMDYLMPNMNGMEATKLIRALPGCDMESLPIVALTASPEAADGLLQAGMNDFLMKPLSIPHVTQILLRYIPDKVYEDVNVTEVGASCDVCEMPAIEGIETKTALENCGSVPVLNKMLGDYARAIDINAEKMQELLKEKNIESYRLEVHGLKSASRIIGAITLSEEFAALEKAAREQNRRYIQAHHEKVMRRYEAFKDKLKAYAENSRGSLGASDDQILQILRRLKKDAECLYLDGVDAKVRELEKCVLPWECSEIYNKLRVCVSDADMAGALAPLEQLISIMEKRISL